MGSHGREAGSTGRWSNVRGGRMGLHKFLLGGGGRSGILSLVEKEARKAEELFTTILRALFRYDISREQTEI